MLVTVSILISTPLSSPGLDIAIVPLWTSPPVRILLHIPPPLLLHLPPCSQSGNLVTWCRINQTNNKRKPPSPHRNSKTCRPTLYQTADGRSRDACTTAAQALGQLSTRASKQTTLRNPQGIHRIRDEFRPQIQAPNTLSRNHGGKVPYGYNPFPEAVPFESVLV